VVFTFNNNTEQTQVRLERAVAASEVSVSPEQIRLLARAGKWGSAELHFRNRGAAPAQVALQRPTDLTLSVQPESFDLPAGAQQAVSVMVDANVLGEQRRETELHWSVDGNARPPLPIVAEARGGGLLAGITGRFRRGKGE